MPTVSSGILKESNFANLKSINQNDIRKEIYDLLVRDEQVVAAFKTIRDQVIFTTKRILVVNVQGLTGKKTSYFTYPFSKVQYFGVETAGVWDADSELVLVFSNGGTLSFDFTSSVDIRKISAIIADFVL